MFSTKNTPIFSNDECASATQNKGDSSKDDGDNNNLSSFLD